MTPSRTPPPWTPPRTPPAIGRSSRSSRFLAAATSSRKLRPVVTTFAPKSQRALVRGHVGACHIAEQSGVLHVTLHGAVGLKAGDAGGLSDPTATLSFGAHPKPNQTLFRSRVLQQTINPLWNERYEVKKRLLSASPTLRIAMLRVLYTYLSLPLPAFHPPLLVLSPRLPLCCLCVHSGAWRF